MKPTDRVGVLGIGALGHLAIQFAAKMGCDVVAFSGSESKREEAMQFVASEFVIIPRGSAQKITMKGKLLDHLFITSSALRYYHSRTDGSRKLDTSCGFSSLVSVSSSLATFLVENERH